MSASRALLLAGLLVAGPALAAEAPGPDKPAPTRSAAERAAAGKRIKIDQMLDTLKDASTDTEAAMLERRLHQAWTESGTPTVTLLMVRGARDFQAAAFDDAERDFDAALDLDPDLAAAYDGRAVARAKQGKFDAAGRDLEEVLKREPRQVFALQHMTDLAEARQDWPAAVGAWEKLLALDPKTAGGDQRLQRLKKAAEKS